MLRSLRSALARFAVRRAAACQRDAPKRAELWLRLGCAVAPTFAESHPALVRLRRAIEDRWGAVAAAQEAAQRSEEHTSELQSPCNLVCPLLLEKKKKHRTLNDK